MPKSKRKGPLKGKAKQEKIEKYGWRSTKAVETSPVTTKEALKAFQTVPVVEKLEVPVIDKEPVNPVLFYKNFIRRNRKNCAKIFMKI